MNETTNSKSFPAVRLERTGGAMALTINGERQLPLIFAFARTHYVARGTPGYDYANDVVYGQIGRVYSAGIRIFQPCMPEIGYGPNWEFDFSHFDTVIRASLHHRRSPLGCDARSRCGHEEQGSLAGIDRGENR